MPVNHTTKLIFIHIPKTGGTSIEHFFGMTETENLLFNRWDRDQQLFLQKHADLCDSEKMNYEPQHYPLHILKKLIPQYPDYFTFTFTRHPYTKLLSEFYYRTNKQITSLNEFNPREFHEWCISYLSLLDDSHKEPQISYIDQSVRFVGKYETLESDMNTLKSQLFEFSPVFITIQNKNLPFLNSTGLNKELLIPHLLNESRQLIYTVYRSDFEAFDYKEAFTGRG